MHMKDRQKGIDIYYGNLPKKCSESIEQNEWLRNGVLWIVIGVFRGIWQFYKGGILS